MVIRSQLQLKSCQLIVKSGKAIAEGLCLQHSVLHVVLAMVVLAFFLLPAAPSMLS